MNENWKSITDYPNYEVSNLGNVRSLRNNIILKPINGNNGYSSVVLYHNKIAKRFNVHRLVATAFIDNIVNKSIVNHKDGNKKNNVHTNLEWVNYSENLIHSYENKLHIPYWKDRFGSNHSKSKAILQYSKTGEPIEKYGSLHEASRITKINVGNINAVCKGKRKFAGGFVWEYA